MDQRAQLSPKGQTKWDDIMETLTQLGQVQPEKMAQRLTRAAIARRLFNSKPALEKGLP